MSLSSLSVQRPVLATVMSIVIVLFGIIGLTYLGVREYPSVDPPIITVSTSYVGANADIIESQITEPIEEAVNGIAGIRSITSVSRDGRSTITVEFNLEVNLETAANDVRDKVSGVVRVLPPDTDPPVVSKADADSDPIIFLNIQSDRRSLLELTDIADNIFKERLQTINGVSEIRIWGSKRYAMRLWIDPEKLAAYDLTPLDVQNALRRENIELPSGSIEGVNTELTVRTKGRLVTPEEFNNLTLKEENGRIVRFRDVGIIWGVLATALFYATPVLYPIEIVPERFHDIILANPLTPIFIELRHLVIDNSAPTALDAAGGWLGLLPAFLITVVLCVVAVKVFSREAPRIAEEL